MFRVTVCVSAWVLLSSVSLTRAGSDPRIGDKTLPSTPRLMSAEKEDLLRSQLPYVDNDDIQRLLDDPSLILYTDDEILPAYQDWSSGLPGVHAPEYNVSANDREPYGNGNVEFPWGAPGGTHRTSNVSTFRFLWLPVDERGQRRPIVWYRKLLSGSSKKGYAWTYPVGTVVGEVLHMRSPDGKLVTFELRVRIREVGEWEVDVFRPFPTRHHLANRIRQLRPQWYDNAKLAKLVRHLEEPVNLLRRTLTDSHSQVAFHKTLGIDTLPEVGDDQLVTELLTWTLFRSALGETWRHGTNGVTTAAPTTLAEFHVIPARYDAGFIEVDRFSCMDCHDTVNHHVDDFQRDRDWYGRIRGSDGIFSFHPFDPSSISYNGSSLPVRMNRKLVTAGLFDKFDPAKHAPEHYQKLLYVDE